MSVSMAWWLCAGVFGLLHFVLVPGLRRHVSKTTTSEVVRSFGTLGVLEVLRSAALALALGAGVLWALMAALTLAGQGSVGRASAALAAMRQLQGATENAHFGLVLTLFTGLVAGLGWLTFKQSQQKASALFAEIDAQERSRVIEDYKQDRWQELPPTDAMQKLAAMFDSEAESLQQARAAGNDTEVARLEALLDEMRGLYFRFDAERRIQVDAGRTLADDMVLPAGASRGDRLRGLLFNRGVLKSAKAGARGLALAGLVLMVPAAATLQLGLAEENVAERAVELDDLRIDLARKEAEAELKTALAARPPAAPPAEERTDAEADTLLLDSFDRGLHTRLLTRALPPELRGGVQRQMLRERILRQYTQARPGGVTTAAGPHAAAEAPLFRQAREHMAETLARLRLGNRNAWRQITAGLPSRADFATPLTRSELAGALAGEVKRAAFAGAVGEFATAHDAHATHFLTELARGKPLAAAEAAAFGEKVGPYWTARTDEALQGLNQYADADGHPLRRTLQEHPPTLHAQTLSAAETRAAEAILRDMPLRSRQAAALVVFQDLLPGRLHDDLRTPAAAVARAVEPGHAPDMAAHRQASAQSFGRSFDFGKLQGYARVGGVLIGRPPEPGGTAADITGFSWQFGETGRLTLRLQARDGTQHAFGPYPAAEVLHALTYAADGRPLAVSMIAADPVPDLKVITHPALEDNASGCRAVQLDREADEATQRAPYRTQAERLTLAHNALYRLAWGTLMPRWAAADTELAADEKRVIASHAAKVLQFARSELQPELQALRVDLAQNTASLPVAKPQFFDAGLVEVARTCARDAAALAGLEACLNQRNLQRPAQRMLAMLPEFQLWSGVRELPWRSDAGLGFLRAPTAAAGSGSGAVPGPGLGPFHFVMQAAFSSRGPAGGDVDDAEPWSFPALQARLAADVAAHIAASRERGQMLQDMSDFTLLQRLFRSALAGQLGAGFPINTLATLSAELNARTARANAEGGYRTPRWNTRELEKYYANVLQVLGRTLGAPHPRTRALLAAAPAAVAACAQRGVAAPADAASAPAAASCLPPALASEARWVQDNSLLPMAEREYAEEVLRMGRLLQLRRLLGVQAPESARPAACPAWQG